MYIVNRYPTRSKDGAIPYKRYYGYRPQVLHLQIFASLVYLYLLEYKRNKMELRLEQYFFLRYDMLSKTYKIYNP